MYLIYRYMHSSCMYLQVDVGKMVLAQCVQLARGVYSSLHNPEWRIQLDTRGQRGSYTLSNLVVFATGRCYTQLLVHVVSWATGNLRRTQCHASNHSTQHQYVVPSCNSSVCIKLSENCKYQLLLRYFSHKGHVTVSPLQLVRPYQAVADNQQTCKVLHSLFELPSTFVCYANCAVMACHAAV